MATEEEIKKTEELEEEAEEILKEEGDKE